MQQARGLVHCWCAAAGPCRFRAALLAVVEGKLVAKWAGGGFLVCDMFDRVVKVVRLCAFILAPCSFRSFGQIVEPTIFTLCLMLKLGRAKNDVNVKSVQV